MSQRAGETVHAVDCDMGEDCSCGVLEGEVVEPREGTLAWLVQQEHVEVQGRRLPKSNRVDLEAGGQLLEQEDNGRCQYVKPNGQRCGAPRTLAYGLCLVHSGGGVQDIRAMGRAGAAAQARLRVRREVLGVGPRRAADPRQLARLHAQDRAQEIAAALLAPLDEDDLKAMEKQRAALAILDATFPQQTTTLTVELPADEAGVQAMGWAEMQQLAAQLLGDSTETEELDPA